MEHGFKFMVKTKDLRKAAFAIAFGATMGKFVGEFCITAICKAVEMCLGKPDDQSCTKDESWNTEE